VPVISASLVVVLVIHRFFQATRLAADQPQSGAKPPTISGRLRSNAKAAGDAHGATWRGSDELASTGGRGTGGVDPDDHR
jgi:hypothetical protein